MLQARLEGLNRDQLIALVTRLVARHPDLMDLVRLPLPGESQPVDTARIHAHVSGILSGMGDDWEASSRAEHELWPLVKLGHQYLERDRIADAAAVFKAIIEPILACYEQLWDHESEIAGIVEECVEGLGACLGQVNVAAERQAILRAILGVYLWDVLESGGYGMDDTPRAILRDRLSDDEHRQVATWLVEALQASENGPGRTRCQSVGRFALELSGSGLEDTELEHLYVVAALDQARLELLLGQGRQREAVSLLREAPRGAIVRLASRLIEAGLAEEAVIAVAEHPAVYEPNGSQVRNWLRERGVSLPDNIEVLLRAISSFQARPSVGRYELLRSEAAIAGQWPAMLARVGELRKDLKGLMPIRARVQADLGNAEAALAELEGLKGSAWRSAAVSIARSLENHDPATSAILYRRLLGQLSARRTKAQRTKAAYLEERLANLEARPD